MQYKDYYRILGLDRGAKPEDIKRAYRRLARKYHPDVSKEPDSEERFKEVGEAYEVLRDPEKRAAYDQLGNNWRAGQEFRPPPGWDVHFDIGGGAGDMGMGGFSDFFESLFGTGRRAGAHGGSHRGRGAGGFAFRGQDQSLTLPISLEEAYHGGSRQLQLGEAGGQRRTVNVKIPRGVSNGQRIRLGGQGGPGSNGAAPGDLFLEIAIQPHPRFRTEGRDVLVDVPVTPWEAALGRTITVPTLGGKVDLRVPAGAQSGQKLRLKGRGLPGSPAGDQYVVLKMVTPPADSARKREFYERMEKELPMHPRADLER